MKQWEINEQKAYKYIKETEDPKAILHGGSDSKAPDIVLSNGDVYEVKSLHAQCGQFTESTAHKYAFSDEVQEYFMGMYDPEELLTSVEKNYYLNSHEICKKWVEAYYRDIKNVKAFLVVDDNGNVTKESLEDYFNNHTFSCTYRRKKSGSSPAASWINKYIPTTWEYEVVGKNWKIKDASLIGQQVKGYDTKGSEKTISIERSGFIRILSNTYTPTFVFNVR